MKVSAKEGFALSTLDYALPETHIARYPMAKRSDSRLLVIPRHGEQGVLDKHVYDMPTLLNKPCLFVLNNTRVMKARLFGHKTSGAKVELLAIEPADVQTLTQLETSDTESVTHEHVWKCFARSNRPLKPGQVVVLSERVQAHVLAKESKAVWVAFDLDAQIDDEAFEHEDACSKPPRFASVYEMLEALGHMPLPPYMQRDGEVSDVTRYQTVFAKHAGAVAAPTASLHLSLELMETLRAQGHQFCELTLHVGPGTFAPVQVDDLAKHPMHHEHYVLSEEVAQQIQEAKANGTPIIAVGTTVVRTLQSAVDASGVLRAGARATDLLIYPPYDFNVVDALMTNFHLPRSTLLALVMAFGGIEPVRKAYAHAIEHEYRFYSYGDATLMLNHDLLSS